ncbi:hypothetical protein [Salinibacter altiplanensis]|uniref:hypothetical protein n=1 Tax=Salinibacter altiplanensis TaxID=1803181 RepID=UPI00131A1803|nr:hypothetical protein [Salinibacter altiplanensis]
MLSKIARRPEWIGIAGGLALLAVEFALVSAVYPPAGLAFLYFLGMTVVLYISLAGKRWEEPVLLFVFYSGLIIIVYYINYITFPEFYGFTPASIAGTDDSYFYSLVASSLPADFPTREFYHTRTHPYELLMEWGTPFTIEHPFEILFFNAVGAVFIPVFSRSLAQVVTKDERVARLTFWLVALCPFLMNHSLVLVRDGWTAALFAGSLAFFLRGKFVRAAVLGAVLFFLRVASGLQLGLVAGIMSLLFLYRLESRKKQVLYLGGAAALGIIALTIVYPILISQAQRLAGGEIIGLLYRETYLDVISSDSFLGRINSQPLPIRLPAALLFFISFPFFAPETVTAKGSFVWRGFMNCIYSIAFIFYFKFLVQGMIKGIIGKSDFSRITVFSTIILISLLSQASMQLRHKTVVMPMIYLLISYGYYNSSKIGRQIGWFALFGIAVANVGKFLTGV